MISTTYEKTICMTRPNVDPSFQNEIINITNFLFKNFQERSVHKT